MTKTDIKHMALSKVAGHDLSPEDERYICNQAAKVTKDKLVYDWDQVTCTNCLKQRRGIEFREVYKSKYKPLKEIIVNWGCVFGSFYTVLYIFKDINYHTNTWPSELQLLLFFIEFIGFTILAVTVTKYVRKILGFDEDVGITVQVI